MPQTQSARQNAKHSVITVVRSLYQFQIDAVDQLRQGYKSHLRQMLKLPTGAGKTTIASHIIECAQRKGRRSLFICDRLTLIDQAARRFSGDGMDVSIIQSNHPDYNPHAPVQVASIQTLARRRIPAVDFIVIDEAHVLYRAHKRIMDAYDNVPVLGLSATPYARGLGLYFSALVAPVSTKELVDQGYLTPPVIYSPLAPDMDGVTISRGDFATDGNRRAAMKIVGDVVDHWIRLGDNRPTLMSCVDIAHAKALVNAFVDRGIPAIQIDAYTPRPDRDAAYAALRSGEIRIIGYVDLLSRGFDEPCVSCLLMCRPTLSLQLHEQQIGRGLRTHEGKTDCKILDFAGNHRRLGRHAFIDYPVPNTLNFDEKKYQKQTKKEKTSKPCPRCKIEKAPGIWECPNCGYKPERQNGVTHEDGELTLISGSEKYTTEQKRSWYAQLDYIRAEKSYPTGWTAHKYKSKFGVWPRHDIKCGPIVPTDEVIRYVKHLNIRYAKRRQSSEFR